MQGLTFSSKLYQDSLIVSTAKAANQNTGALISSTKSVPFEFALDLYEAATQPCTEYYCQASAATLNYHLDMLNKLQKQVYKTVSPALAASLKLLAHSWYRDFLLLFLFQMFI